MSDVALMHAQDVVVFVQEKRRWCGCDLVRNVDRAANVRDRRVVGSHFAKELQAVSRGVETHRLDTHEYDLVGTWRTQRFIRMLEVRESPLGTEDKTETRSLLLRACLRARSGRTVRDETYHPMNRRCVAETVEDLRRGIDQFRFDQLCDPLRQILRSTTPPRPPHLLRVASFPRSASNHSPLSLG